MIMNPKKNMIFHDSPVISLKKGMFFPDGHCKISSPDVHRLRHGRHGLYRSLVQGPLLRPSTVTFWLELDLAPTASLML